MNRDKSWVWVFILFWIFCEVFGVFCGVCFVLRFWFFWRWWLKMFVQIKKLGVPKSLLGSIVEFCFCYICNSTSLALVY